ncbi:MAG: ATP-binding protein [Prevotella sp.]|nr:ATP-binding protein [Prevotella sp.]
MCQIIGRKEEIAVLKNAQESGRAEFVAVYGRRRVGKTFLINEVLRDDMTFRHTGLSPYDRKRKVTLRDQLQNFHFSLIRHGMEGGEPPRSWMEAFFRLEQFLERQDNGSRQIVFIDELPWMDTARSGFLTALEGFWNGWACSRHNMCLVVCGSATSWMLDNIINNKGGLYGRLTHEIQLSPFNLHECEEFFLSRGIKMSRYNTAQAYMVLGGIPYYLDFFNPSMSLAQNIDALFFSRKAKLGDEFDRLFHSVFDHAEACMNIVRLLGKRHSGFTRDEIARQTGINPNGDFTKILKALIGSAFISTYIPFGTGQRDVLYYKLADCFCWFWLHFKEQKQITETDYWMHHLKESEIASWRGIAFEEVCLQHIDQIKRALQVAGVSSNESSFILNGDDGQEGMQIDLLIDRADDVVNVCEMKFCKSEYVVTKAYSEKIVRRTQTLEQLLPSKTFHPTLISAAPVHRNEYSDTFLSQLTIDDLFIG